MYSPREAEMAALNKCGALLEELEDQAKVRVLKYLVEMFDLAKYLQLDGVRGEEIKSTNSHSFAKSQKLIDNDKMLKSDKEDEIIDDTQYEESKNEYPTIKDIVMRDLPKVELEWVLIYAFYASNFAKEKFTRTNILEKYKESERRDEQRIKNLSGNFKACVIKKWFKGINEETYIVTIDGISYAEQIIAGKSKGKPKAFVKKKIIKIK